MASRLAEIGAKVTCCIPTMSVSTADTLKHQDPFIQTTRVAAHDKRAAPLKKEEKWVSSYVFSLSILSHSLGYLIKRMILLTIIETIECYDDNFLPYAQRN